MKTMKVTVIFMTVSVIQSCKGFILSSIIAKLDLSKLDLINFHDINFDDNILDQIDHESLQSVMNQGYYVASNISSPYSMTINIREFENLMNSASFKEDDKRNFIKDPLETYFVHIGHDHQLNMLQNVGLRDQPYVFALKTHPNHEFEVLEVQSYSRLVKLIAKGNLYQNSIDYFEEDIIKRRSDFNGQPIRITLKSSDFDNTGALAGRMGEAVAAFQDKSNFSIHLAKFTSWGSLLSNGSWTGSIGQILNEEIDLSPLELSNSPSRLEVVQPGHAFGRSDVWLYYPRQGRESHSMTVLLSIFNVESRIVISVMFLTFTVIFMTMKRVGMVQKEQLLVPFEQSLVACTRTLFGQSFEQDNFIDVKFKKTKFLVVFIMSLYGSMIYWHYTGVLISNLTAPGSTPPIKQLDDLRDVTSMRLYTSVLGETRSQLINWAKKSKENMGAYKRIIEPHQTRSITGTLRNLTGGDFAYISDEFYVKRAISNINHWTQCDFLKAPIDVTNFPNSWMYPKNSILQPLFDSFWLELIERGIFDAIVKKYRTPDELCQSDSTEAVNLNFVRLLFTILSIGIGGSIVVFIFELMKFKLVQ